MTGSGKALPGWIAATADGSFVARTAGLVRTLSFVEDGILRLRYGERRSRSFAVVHRERPKVGLQVEQRDGQVVIESRALRVTLDADGRLAVAAHGGELLLEESAKSVRFGKEGRWSIERPSPADERFYGFGERCGPLQKRGQKMVLWNTDPFGEADGGYSPGTDPLYVSIPFFVGVRAGIAYGLLTDVSYRMTMDMAASDPLAWRVEAAGGVPDQYLLAGPSIAEVLGRYGELTGRMPLPPRWSLGYHQCRWGYWPDREVREVCRGFRDRKIPADGIWLDIQHLHECRVFTWDPKGFPKPRELVEELAGIGFKTTVIVDPGIKVDSSFDVYRQGLEGRFYVERGGEPCVDKLWPGDSVFPDFSSRAAREWWAGLMRRPIADGVRGIWLDMNEPSTIRKETGRTLPNDAQGKGEGEPIPLAELHNVYASWEAMATWEGLRAAAPQRRPFILTRAAFAGIQRYAAIWTGDAPSKWETLRETLPMMLGLGLSGVPFVGSDVGGFSGKASPELYARWMQLGAWSPFFRAHCSIKGNRQEPWSFGKKVEAICREAIRERYRLLPYFYSLVEEASRTGLPVLRPLVLESPGDERCAGIDDEAMVGPWLLIAPVLTEGTTRREVWLPQGRWADNASGRVHEGPCAVEVEAPLERIPVFVREGAIVPWAEPAEQSELQLGKPLGIDLFPGREPSRFGIYEDEGDGFGQEQGRFERTELRMEREGAELVLRAAREGQLRQQRRFLVRLRWGGERISGATLDGTPLPRLDGMHALTEASGWAETPAGPIASVPPSDRWELRFRTLD
jgi:alpha-glucosidase